MPRILHRLGSVVRSQIASSSTAAMAVVTIATSLGLMASLTPAGLPI